MDDSEGLRECGKGGLEKDEWTEKRDIYIVGEGPAKVSSSSLGKGDNELVDVRVLCTSDKAKKCHELKKKSYLEEDTFSLGLCGAGKDVATDYIA